MRSLILMSLTCLAMVAMMAVATDGDKPRSGLHLYYVQNSKPVLTSHVAEGRKVSPVVTSESGLFRLGWNVSNDRRPSRHIQ